MEVKSCIITIQYMYMYIHLLPLFCTYIRTHVYVQVTMYNRPYARLRHFLYFSVLNRTLSVSCSTVWGVQDGRIYSVTNKLVQWLSSIGHETTPILNQALQFFLRHMAGFVTTAYVCAATVQHPTGPDYTIDTSSMTQGLYMHTYMYMQSSY